MNVHAAGHAAWPARSRALPARAATGAPATDDADAVLLFASLQPLIEQRGSLVVHLTGAGPAVGTTRVAHALTAAAGRHPWCRTLSVDGAGDGPSLLSRHRSGAPLPDRAGPATLAGPADGVPRPAELARLYAELRARFALILADLQPVGAAPDTAILSQAADLTLLVVRAEHTSHAAVARARALLEQGGASRIGLVLTGRRPRLPAILDRLL